MSKKQKRLSKPKTTEQEENAENLPAVITPKFESKSGFGVQKKDLVPETPDIKLWRKEMLKTYTGLLTFGNLGVMHPDRMLQVLNDIGYDMEKLESGEDTKKKRSFQTGSPFVKIVELSQRRMPYIHSHTSSSTIIETADTIYLYGCNDYDYKELHLRRKLKAEILDNIVIKGMEVPELSNEDSDYMIYSDAVREADTSQSSVDIVEFDISKAYYVCAHYLGYMSDEMFKKCITLPKHIRLRFIGSIATFKRHYLRSGFKITGYSGEVNEVLRNVWFHIVKHVDDCMHEFMEMAGDAFLMYYVDGIYLKKYKKGKLGQPAELVDYKPMLEKLTEKYGFAFSEGEIYGYTKCYLKAGRGKHMGLHMFKKNDFDRPAFTGYWMRKQFSIKGGGKREMDIMPKWQQMVDAYEQAGGDAVKAAKLMEQYNDL